MILISPKCYKQIYRSLELSISYFDKDETDFLHVR